MSPIELKFMVEKRKGLGEDSNPLSIIKDDNSYAVGVFDGMGGSGAATCKSQYGPSHTKAYVASRIVRDTLNTFIKNHAISDITPDDIKMCVKRKLEQEKNNYPAKTSILRSKMVRDYPTTLALTTAYENENGIHTVTSYWAGDSRNYLWTAQGFYQISKDDLDTDLDPLENLRNDGALSNCVCADRNFNINSQTIEVKEKFLIISATDGCFNYFTSPMHFQDVLHSGLMQAENIESWKTYCQEKIAEVTGDDYSLSLLAIGFGNFNDLKNTFVHSEITNIKKIKDVQDKIQMLWGTLNETEKELETLIQNEWNRYKVSYLHYLNKTDDVRTEEKLNETKVRDSKEMFSTDLKKEKIKVEKIDDTETGSEKTESDTIPASTLSVAGEENCEGKPHGGTNNNEEMTSTIMEVFYEEEKTDTTELPDSPVGEVWHPDVPAEEEKDRSTLYVKPDKISFEEENKPRKDS